MKKIRSLLWMLCLSAAFLCGCSNVQETAGSAEPAVTPEAIILDETSAFSVFSEYEAFPQKQNTWYTKNNLIVHATGGIDGLSYTNSKDAMTQSLKKGYRVLNTFEALKNIASLSGTNLSVGIQINDVPNSTEIVAIPYVLTSASEAAAE